MDKGIILLAVFAIMFISISQPVSAGIFSDFWEGVKEIFGFGEPQLAPTRGGLELVEDDPIIIEEPELIPEPEIVPEPECSSGETRICFGNNIGECFAGTETCVNNLWDGVCVNKISPTIEVCDSKDNNCDGQIDEGGVCTEANTSGTEGILPPTEETAPPADVPVENQQDTTVGSTFSSASEGNMIQDQIIQSQNALNVKGFDAGSAVGTTFTDSINPYTGALMITQTDAVVSGRRGMDIIVTRQYSSNIFASINQYDPSATPPSDCDGTGVNDIACDGSNPYETCKTPNTIISPKMNVLTGTLDLFPHTQYMNRCYTDSSENQDASSYIRAKYLGRGWSMNYMENKIRDPTPLVYRTLTNSENIIRQPGDIAVLTYQFLSLRGINSISMSVDGNSQELIHPSMYKKDSKLFEQNYNLWTTNLEVIDPIDPVITAQTSSSFPDSITLYTSDLSPVFIKYQPIEQMASLPGQSPSVAIYYAKNGRRYDFSHYVPFCGRYDDLAAGMVEADISTEGNCYDLYSVKNLAITGDPHGLNKLFTWAENTYVGVYLTKIADSFGNTIELQYYKIGETINSPYVSRATNAGGHVEFTFENGDPNSPFTGKSDDINDRLDKLEFTGPKGDIIYRQYEYTTQGTSSVPLLEESFLSTDQGGVNKIPGTKYTYGYDPITGELTDVFLPTGAHIHYEYAWATSLPVLDIARIFQTPLDIDKVSRRVIYRRTVTGGGDCLSVGGCVWEYSYKAIDKTVTGGSGYYELETSVLDPFGRKTIYNSFPATVTPSNAQVT